MTFYAGGRKGRGWAFHPPDALSGDTWIFKEWSFAGQDSIFQDSEITIYSRMGNSLKKSLYMWLVNTNGTKNLQKNITVPSFLPTLLFPHSTSLKWRRNVHRHCPSRMVSGFVAKAQNSGITDPVLFSILGSLSSLGKSLCLYVSGTEHFFFPSRVFIRSFQDLCAVRTS